jgi:hypothetical protein
MWPSLPLASWSDTAATLHMWMQIVGKVGLALSPSVNHWWQVPLYVSAHGLTTTTMPYRDRSVQMEFDFLDHKLVIRDSEGQFKMVQLYARSVADFYREFTGALKSLAIDVKIWPKPVEVPDPIPFPEDNTHASYDPVPVRKFHRILLSTDAVFKDFRGGFLGKASPSHFFWGSFDLAVTRFSGRRAPERAGADAVTREAYSHECSSAGFWPGSGALQDPAFYAYAAPEPPGYSGYPARPPQAYYHPEMREFILMYDDVRKADSPEGALHEFLQSTYVAAATLGKWDRASLERPAAAEREP